MQVRRFQTRVVSWYKKHGRHSLPWRLPAGRQEKQFDPYRILVSELMLQQTQVARVIMKYQSFVRSFPTVRSLARAKTPELLRAWQGLGYNRRALYLREAARKVVHDYDGRVPQSVRALESFPGVGPATARAVAVFAWNSPEIFLETNIRRVYIHHFFKKRRRVLDRDILPILQKTLYRENPRMWYSALMDYGSTLGTTLRRAQSKNPNRKSARYTKQSRFLGSQRYARAKILSYLLRKRGATSRDIAVYVSGVPALRTHKKNLGRVLFSLEREGFLKRRGGNWKIAP